MRAARMHSYGGPEDLVVEEMPDVAPGPGQVVVRVEAASVNFPDLLIMANRYQVSSPLPFTPGSEYAGTVLRVGAGVEGLRTGDAVFGSAMTGAFAEEVLARPAQLQPLPAGFDFVHAAATGVTYRTAFHALRSVAEARPGEWVLVLGAAGGVGTAAVDLGTRMGLRVVAAASSSERLEVCRGLGAEAGIDYENEDLKERAKELTGGGADVVIDPVGGRWAEQALRAMRWGGRFVTIGFASGEIPRIPLNLVLLKGVAIKGLDIRAFPEHEPDAVARGAEELRTLLAAGARPHVSATYPLAEVGAALAAVRDRRTTGKVVVVRGRL